MSLNSENSEFKLKFSEFKLTFSEFKDFELKFSEFKGLGVQSLPSVPSFYTVSRRIFAPFVGVK